MTMYAECQQIDGQQRKRWYAFRKKEKKGGYVLLEEHGRMVCDDTENSTEWKLERPTTQVPGIRETTMKVEYKSQIYI